MIHSSQTAEEIQKQLWKELRHWASRPDSYNGFCLGWSESFRHDSSSDEDLEFAEQTLWKWVSSGLLYPFKASSNLGNNSQFKPTQYGYKVLLEQDDPILTPYDPDGYIRNLEEGIGELDPIIKTYLDQAMRCFHTQAFLASVVMLGAASEQTMLLIMAKFPWKKLPRENSNIGPKFDQMLAEIKVWEKERLSAVKSATRPDWDQRLEAGFNIIRVSRNEAGHPELLREMEQREVLGHFILFESYVRTAYGFMRFLDTH